MFSSVRSRLGTDLGVERLLVERVRAERDELRPLVAVLQHVGEQCFDVGQAGVAMQEHGA